MLNSISMAMVNVNKLQYFCVVLPYLLFFYFYRATTLLLGKEVHSCLVGRNRGLPLLVLWYESQLFCFLMKLRQPLIHQVSPKSKRPWIRWEIVTFYSISVGVTVEGVFNINPLNAELNPTCQLLALLGAHRILHVSRIRVNTRHWIIRLALIAFCLMIILL